MSTSNDFGELKAPVDLVRKLKHDLQRMTAAKSDQYAAFDFFITADSIVDWLYPDVSNDKAATTEQSKKRKALRDIDLLRITSHVANGAKHFVVTRHNSITGIEKSRYVEEGYAEEDYFEDPLFVHLTTQEAINLGIESPINAIQLATLVSEYWSHQIHAC